MVAGLLDNLELPGIAKSALIDPATGKMTPAMQRTLGSALSKQFNEAFIEETIKTALSAVAKRDEAGDPVLNYDARPVSDKQAEAVKNRLSTNKEMHKEARLLVKASISNFVRTAWVNAQHKFDRGIEKAFGRFGLGVKTVLDAVFRFVFFKVIGTVLSIILWPAKRLALEVIYRIASLDKNIDTVIDMFDHIPEDQPEGYDYAVYHENLVYQMMQAMAEAVGEVANEADSDDHDENLINEIVDQVVELPIR